MGSVSLVTIMLRDLLDHFTAAEIGSALTQAGLPQPGQVQPNPLPETSLLSYRIIDNHRSHIYHRPDCPNYSQVALQNRVEFNNTTEAEAAGYRRAGNCP